MYANNSKLKILKIENDMQQLSETMLILNELVDSQGESIKTLEDYVEVSKQEAQEALEELQDIPTPYSWYIRAGLASFFIYLLL